VDYHLSCKTSLVLPYVFILILFCLEKTELCIQEDTASHLAPQDLLDRDLWVLLEQEKDGQDQALHRAILALHKIQW